MTSPTATNRYYDVTNRYYDVTNRYYDVIARGSRHFSKITDDGEWSAYDPGFAIIRSELSPTLLFLRKYAKTLATWENTRTVAKSPMLGPLLTESSNREINKIMYACMHV